GGREVAVAHVDAERQRPRDRRAVEKPRDQAERQVVDHLEAEILERMDRRRAAGARRAGHEDDALAALPASIRRALHRVLRHSARPDLRYCRIAAGKWALSIL